LIKVADETRTVSKSHLALGVDGNGMYVIDRGSTNGSTVTATATFAQSVQTQSNVQGISAGTQVGRTGVIVFSNSNGISFGLNGSVVTAHCHDLFG
jgi:pSer/pThr/pTyr-binding forkhead associated (FHA) protein